MHPEIEKLIKLAIADGEITEKERAVIMRKAEKLGEDLDEVEMILDGELALLKKEKDNLQSHPESNKEGVIKKCPSCGAPVKSFTTKCPECGHDFIGKKASHTFSELSKLLLKAESEERAKPQPTGFWGIDNRLNMEVAVRSRLVNVINSFPIPITKEDIIEFLSQAVPKCRTLNMFQLQDPHARNTHNALANAWKNKCHEIVIKARFSMKDDKKILEEIETYAKQLKIK